MKRLSALLLVVAIAALAGCMAPLPVEDVFVVTMDADRPPCNVSLSADLNVPDGGVYYWTGPWGVQTTLENSMEYYLRKSNGNNPIEFSVRWTDGTDTVEPDHVFVTFRNSAPVVIRYPTFSVMNWISGEGTGQYMTYLQTSQMYIVDLRNCAEDPDGDPITVKSVQVMTFHKPGFVLENGADLYSEIVDQYESGDYVAENPNAIYFYPYDPDRICWGDIDGRFAWSPRFWLNAGPNGMPYAPMPMDPAYPVIGCGVDAGTVDLPFGGAIIFAVFEDGMGGESEGLWIFSLSPMSCN